MPSIQRVVVGCDNVESPHLLVIREIRRIPNLLASIWALPRIGEAGRRLSGSRISTVSTVTSSENTAEEPRIPAVHEITGWKRERLVKLLD